jgi:hypothetical protein
VPRNAERTVALRKLLEAKDAAVRANLPAPGVQLPKSGGAVEEWKSDLNEPIEIGGHDQDRDGAPKFSG